MEATGQAASGLESENMASGTIALTRTGSGYLTGQILWSSQSNGSAANTSTVTAKLQIQRSALNSTTGTFTGSFKVGSTSKTISWYGTLPTYEWVTIETVTATVGHNADGKGSCYLYALVNGPTGTTMEGTYVSGSATVTLDGIPRFAGMVSATDFTDEGNPTITYSNPAGNAVELLQACISLTGSNADVPYRDIPKTGTKYTFSLTESERNTLRAASPNSGTLTVHVYIRSQIGGSTQTDGVACRMNIVNANPVVSFTVVDTNSATTTLTGDNAILVALHSKAKVTISATAKKYATIKTKKVTHGAASLSGDGTLSITNNPIKITVTDSRGNRTVQTATNTIVPYINPTCAIGNNLPEAGGDFSLVVTGQFYNGAIGKTTNAIEVQYRYKAAGGSYGNWTTFATVAKKGNSYTATAKLTGLDYQTVYTFQARVIDAIHDAVNVSSVYSAEKAVVTEPVFDWGENDFRFNVPVYMNNNMIVDHIISPKVISVSTDTALTKNLQSVYAAMANRTVKTVCLEVQVSGLSLSGGIWFVTLYKADTSYGIMQALRYASNYFPHRYSNVLYSDTWHGWTNSALEPYPVGSYYISANATSPASLFGGTWQRIESRFLWGAPASSTLGLTAGEQNHVLTVSEIPSHGHSFNQTVYSNYPPTTGSTQNGYKTIAYTTSSTLSTNNTGGGTAHNNMPPYVNVAIWRREA